MGYEKIDAILEAWAQSHKLHIFKTDREMEVRSVEVVSPAGKRFQIWVDVPDSAGQVLVHVWDYKRRREDFSTSVDALRETLDKARKVVADWSI